MVIVNPQAHKQDAEDPDSIECVHIAFKTIVVGVLEGTDMDGIDLWACEAHTSVGTERWWQYRSKGFIGAGTRELEIRVARSGSSDVFPEWPFELIMYVAEVGDVYDEGTTIAYHKPVTGGVPATNDMHVRCSVNENCVMLFAADAEEVRTGSYRGNGAHGVTEIREIDETGHADLLAWGEPDAVQGMSAQGTVDWSIPDVDDDGYEIAGEPEPV